MDWEFEIVNQRGLQTKLVENLFHYAKMRVLYKKNSFTERFFSKRTEIQ